VADDVWSIATSLIVSVAGVLLIRWGPVPWPGQILPLRLLTVAAFVWLEPLMKRAVAG
jgi:hypothetical protein